MTPLDERWAAYLARRKAAATEADELAVAICDLWGGPARKEKTLVRNEVFAWVRALPRFAT